MTSMTLVTGPGNERAVELRVTNQFHRTLNFRVWRQVHLGGDWAPTNPMRFQADESWFLPAGHEQAITLKVHPSGGRYRFHLRYARPRSAYSRFIQWVQLRLKLRDNSSDWQSEVLVTEELSIPPSP